jgi:hypothetical protein
MKIFINIILIIYFFSLRIYGLNNKKDTTFIPIGKVNICSFQYMNWGLKLLGVNYPIFTGKISNKFTSNIGYAFGFDYRYKFLISNINVSFNSFRVKEQLKEKGVWKKGDLCHGGDIDLSIGYLYCIEQFSISPQITATDLEIYEGSMNSNDSRDINLFYLGSTFDFMFSQMGHEGLNTTHLTMGFSIPLLSSQRIKFSGVIIRMGFYLCMGV